LQTGLGRKNKRSEFRGYYFGNAKIIAIGDEG